MKLTFDWGINMNKDYTWKTPEEVIDLLLTVPDGTSVDFTFETPENECENFEPSGWYGVRLAYMFGNNVICMGTWGGGNVYSKEYFEDEEMYIIFNDYCKKHGQNHVLCVSDKYNGS